MYLSEIYLSTLDLYWQVYRKVYLAYAYFLIRVDSLNTELLFFFNQFVVSVRAHFCEAVGKSYPP